MSGETFYCYNCGEYTMIKDDEGYFFCPECHFVSDEDNYEELGQPGSKFEMYVGVYPEVFNSLGESLVCPYCGSPILERGPGDYICSCNNCGYDPNEDPDLFTL